MTFDEFMLVMQDIVSKDYSTHSGKKVKMLVKQAWDAATEEVKKDHFKIEEEIEWAWDSENWTKGYVGVMVNKSNPEPRVRRMPAWEPKNGEPVLAKNKSGYVFSAFSAGGNKIYLPDGIAEEYDVKPFKPLCDGKPWDEA